jgi:hypothetical protein
MPVLFLSSQGVADAVDIAGEILNKVDISLSVWLIHPLATMGPKI